MENDINDLIEIENFKKVFFNAIKTGIISGNDINELSLFILFLLEKNNNYLIDGFIDEEGKIDFAIKLYMARPRIVASGMMFYDNKTKLLSFAYKIGEITADTEIIESFYKTHFQNACVSPDGEFVESEVIFEKT